MDLIFIVFIFLFFSVSVFGMCASIYYGGKDNLSTNCRSAAGMSFVIGLILLYLQYVFS